MRKVNENAVKDKFLACPYCGNQLAETWSACCGEAGHGETAYELVSGEVLLESEIELVTNNK